MSDALAIVDVVNERAPQYRRPRKGSSWGFSPNIRHHVEREKPPAPPKPKPTPAAPTIAKPPSPVGRFIRDYAEIVDLARAQAAKIDISRLETDRLAGLPEGHSGHVLAPSFSKLIGPAYLLPLLEVLGVRLIAVVDPELVARTLAKRAPPQRSHVRRQLTGTHGD
jgi:hypothetical protein